MSVAAKCLQEVMNMLSTLVTIIADYQVRMRILSHSLWSVVDKEQLKSDKQNRHCAKKPVTTMLTYPWKCTVLHCNHLGNTWKPLVLMT